MVVFGSFFLRVAFVTCITKILDVQFGVTLMFCPVYFLRRHVVTMMLAYPSRCLLPLTSSDYVIEKESSSANHCCNARYEDDICMQNNEQLYCFDDCKDTYDAPRRCTKVRIISA